MKANTLVIMAIVIAVGGTWAQGKKLTEKQIAGAVVLLLFFAAGEEINPEITTAFGWLVLAGITSAYGLSLFKRIGELTGQNTPSKPAGKLPGQTPGNGAGGRGPAAQ